MLYNGNGCVESDEVLQVWAVSHSSIMFICYLPGMLSWTEDTYVSKGLDVVAQSCFTWPCSDAASNIHTTVASGSEKLQESENEEFQLCRVRE